MRIKIMSQAAKIKSFGIDAVIATVELALAIFSSYLFSFSCGI
jgi:hypothetical protein